MNYHIPQCLWLATGGAAAGQLNDPQIQRSLVDRCVTLFPDGGKYEQWYSKVIALQDADISEDISEEIELLCREVPDTYSNYDLRDLYSK